MDLSTYLYISYASCSRGVHQISNLVVLSQFYSVLLCSSLRVIPSSSPRSRRSPFLIIFVTRLGLAHRNRRPLPRSVSWSRQPHSLSSRPAHTHTLSIPTFAAYRNYIGLRLAVCGGRLPGSVAKVSNIDGKAPNGLADP